MTTLQELFLREVRELHAATRHWQKALPRFAKAASNEEMKELLEDHEAQVEGQLERLEEIFTGLVAPARGGKAPATELLLKDTQDLLAEKPPKNVRDAALLSVALRFQHLAVAHSQMARTLAEIVDADEAADLLAETLDEQNDFLESLIDLTEHALEAEPEEDPAEEP